MSRLSPITVVGLLGLLGAGVAGAQGEPGALPLSAVIEQARTVGPDMALARGDVEVARQHVGSAASFHLPRLSVSERQTYRYNNPERYTYSYEEEVGGACVDPSGSTCLPVVVIDGVVTAPENRLSSALSFTGVQPVIAPREVVAIRQAQAAVDLTEVKVKSTEERLVLDLLSAYFDLQASAAQREVYDRSLALEQELLANVERKVQTGQATELDLKRARLDVVQAESRIRQLDREVRLGVSGLALQSGLSEDVSLRVCAQEATFPADGPLDLSGATRLRFLEEQAQMDRLGLSAARTALIPTLSVVGGLTFTGNGESMEAVVESFMFDSWYVGGNLSLSLFEGLGRYHSNTTARLELEQGQRKLDVERLDLNQDDLEAAARLSALAEDLALLDQAITLSEAAVEATRARYLAGTATFEMWTFSRQALEDQRLRRVATLKQQWQLTAYRWINAGHMDELMERISSGEAEAAGRGACSPILAARPEERR